MLTKLKESYERLVSSKEFKNKGFLASAFLSCPVEDLEKSDWQLDFYDEKTDTMTAYTVHDNITGEEDSEVFRDEEKKVEIEELKLDEIKIDFEKLKEKLDMMLEGHRETPLKITIILQKQHVPLWNILYITKNFNLLNIKLSASDGEILEDKLINLISFEKGDYKG